MQTDSKFAIIFPFFFFFFFNMYLNGKRVEKKLGEFNYIYKLFKIFSAQTRLLPVY